MQRRTFLLAGAAARLWAESGSAGPGRVYWEAHGPKNGKPLFLGFPIMASYAEIFGAANAAVKQSYLDALADRFRVVLVDYPGIGKTGAWRPEDMTADRVCADMLAVADAAGFRDFAWCGHLWGAVIGLLLASRTRRINALVCGNWPPLGAPYADMLRGTRANAGNPPPHARVILRTPEQYRQWVTFYESLRGWSGDAAAKSIQCPRLALYGEKAESGVADIRLPFAEILRARRQELEALGWKVREVPGRDTGLILDGAVVGPIVRDFLTGA